jgi:xanthine dehydrogenase YagR molybdenum-binding subunit
LGSAVYDATTALKKKIIDLAKENAVFHTADIHTAKPEDFVFGDSHISLAADKFKRLSLSDVLKSSGLNQLEVTEESKGTEEAKKYASYSYSVHFVKLLVNPATGVVRVNRVVSVGDAGKIISPKQAAGQMIGGAVGGIGMALMEEGVVDHRYGRWVNNNFADYHVPVHADVPHIEALFVDKPDLILNPIGAKGMGEIALIGFAAAVANAVYHATGKRIRELPITPDKLI